MKTVFITGVSSSIGLSICHRLLDSGYKVIGTYLNNKDKLSSIENNDNVILYSCDLRKEEDILSIYKDLKENNIKIDVIINNACTYHDDYIENKTKKDFMDILEVNVVGSFLIVKYLTKLMKESGVIINMASSDGVNTVNELNYDYACSKAALINLTKSLSIIYPNYRVYALSPNWVDTSSTREMDSDYLDKEMDKVGQLRLIKPEEIASIILNFIRNKYQSGCNYLINIDMKGCLTWMKLE